MGLTGNQWGMRYGKTSRRLEETIDCESKTGTKQAMPHSNRNPHSKHDDRGRGTRTNTNPN